MISESKSYFFDVDEFEDIVQYYSEKMMVKCKYWSIIYIKFKLCPLFWLVVLNLCFHTQNHKEALKYLNKAEAIGPYNIDLFYTKGTIFSQLRKSEKPLNNTKSTRPL